MSNFIKDEAICLRVIDFSETSQVVMLFVRTTGLVSLLAKGTRKIPARTRSPAPEPLDLFSFGQVVFIPPRGNSELGTLSSWQVLDHHPALRRSLVALYPAQMAAEITLLLLNQLDPHPELFDQLRCALEGFPGPDPQRMLLAYMKAALSLTGYQPRLDVCCVCSKPASAASELVFVPALGGICCRDCTRDRTVVKITAALALALDRLPPPRFLQNGGAPTPVAKRPDPEALLLAAKLLIAHICSVADRKLRTESLVKNIFGAAKNTSYAAQPSSIR